MRALHHVDEIAHDQAADIAELDLATDLLDRFLVDAVGHDLGVAVVAALAGVHVDGDHRLGLVDDERAAGGQGHLAGEDSLDLLLDAEGVEERDLAVVGEELGGTARADDPHERVGAADGGRVVDDDLIDLARPDVAQGPHEQVALGVEQAGLVALAQSLVDVLPKPLEVGEVALQFGLGLVHARGAQDEAEFLGQVERVEDLTHGPALVLVLDLAADADLVHIREHDQEPAGDAQVAGEGRALGGNAFLENLNDDLLAPLEAALDRRALATRGLLADLLGGVLILAGEVLRVKVRDVEEAVDAVAEVDERGLD